MNVLKDIAGNEVKAVDIHDVKEFDNLKRGDEIMLRNEDFTFWADVELKTKRNGCFKFESTTYGTIYRVDRVSNIVTIE